MRAPLPGEALAVSEWGDDMANDELKTVGKSDDNKPAGRHHFN